MKKIIAFIVFSLIVSITFFYRFFGDKLSFLANPNIFLNILGVVNVILILILLYIPLRRLLKPYFEGRKTGLYNVKIRTKFTLIALFLVVVPSLIILFMATSIIYNIMNNWHNPDLLGVLKGAEKIVTKYQSDIASETAHFTKVVGEELNPSLLSDRKKLASFLDSRLKKYNLSSLEIYKNGDLLIMVKKEKEPLGDLKAVSMVNPELLKKLSFSRIEQLPTGAFVRFGTLAPFSSLENKYLIVGGKLIIQNIATELHAINLRYERFSKVLEDISSLKTFNITSLLLIGFMAIFSGLWMGIKFTDMFMINFEKLVRATEKVAKNEYDFGIEVKGKDEFSKVLESFNNMLETLRMHEQEIRLRNVELEGLNKSLREKKRFFETVLNNLPIGVIALKRFGNVMAINTFSKKLLGIKGRVHEGIQFPTIAKSSKAGKVFLDLIEQMSKSGEHFLKKHFVFELEDQVVSTEVRCMLMKDNYSEEVGYLIIIEDITELEQAQKMLAWKEAVRRIVHELKNPLTPIKLSAERIKRRAEENAENLKEIVLESIKPMIEEINVMQYLIENFSRYAKMPPPEMELTDLNSLIRDILNLYSSLPENIELREMLAENIPEIEVDRKLLKRALINIIKNAVNAVEAEGEGTVTIKTIYFASSQKVSIEISDTGTGIPDTLKEKIFIPYFSTKPKGDGLGLAIVRNIVQAHNGHIFVKDNFPRGTTFVIELPV